MLLYLQLIVLKYTEISGKLFCGVANTFLLGIKNLNYSCRPARQGFNKFSHH